MEDVDSQEQPAAATTTRRTRRNGAGKKVVTTRQEFVDDADETELSQLPGLFALSDIEEHSIVRVRVYRKDPEEGFLGYLDDPDFSENVLSEKWGGSQYRLEGLSNTGQVRRVIMVKVAGDPIFVSRQFKLEWEKRRGIEPPAPPAQQGMSVQDMMAFMREQDNERRKTEDERRQREADERRQHEERMRKLELEAEDRRRKDERDREERKAREEKDREERRAKDENDREERRRKEAKEADERARAHTDQMLSMVRASSDQALALAKAQVPVNPQNALMDAVKVIGVIKEAFGNEQAGPEDSDPLSLIIKHGGDWLKGIGDAATGMVREIKGNPQQVVGQPTAPQLTAASPEGLVIPSSSPLAGKLQNLVGTIAAQGQNPELVLSHIVDNLQATLDAKRAAAAAPPVPAAPTPPVPDAPAPPSPVVAPPPVAAAPATATPAAPRATVNIVKTARGSTRISFN